MVRPNASRKGFSWQFDCSGDALPVWARNLAFRLACLQRPEDVELLRAAASDLHAFGPDWDTIAEDLYRQADALAAGQEATFP